MSERNHVNGLAYAWGAAAQIDLITQQPNADELWAAFFVQLCQRGILDELANRAEQLSTVIRDAG